MLGCCDQRASAAPCIRGSSECRPVAKSSYPPPPFAALAGPGTRQTLNVGVTDASSDVPFFIADKRGYFKAEGLDVNFIRFNSAAKMIAPLGTGELDVASGATSAALYNAVKRGVRTADRRRQGEQRARATASRH